MRAQRDLTGALWVRSTRSGANNGACVEVARNLKGIVAVRDSKNPTDPALVFSPTAWVTFTRNLQAGGYDA